MSSVRNAGESAICPMRAQPSAEIVRVECAKCRRECDLSHARATLCGDRACRVREMQATVRFVRCPRNPLRRSCVSSARNAGEHWRLCSTTLVRGVSGELEESPTRVSRNSVPLECLTRVSLKSVLQEYPTRVSYKSAPQECRTRVSHKSVLQDCPTRVSYKSGPQECPTRVSHKSVPQSVPQECPRSVPQECPTRVSHKSVPQECPTRVSYKSVPEECPTRVSYKSVPQECPTRLSHKSVPQQCPIRVSH